MTPSPPIPYVHDACIFCSTCIVSLAGISNAGRTTKTRCCQLSTHANRLMYKYPNKNAVDLGLHDDCRSELPKVALRICRINSRQPFSWEVSLPRCSLESPLSVR